MSDGEVIIPDEVLPPREPANPDRFYAKREAYDQCMTMLYAIRGDGRALITVADVDEVIDGILDLRNRLELEDGNEQLRHQ